MDVLVYDKTKCLDFSDKIEVNLFKIFVELNQIYGATYMSYTFDIDDSIRFSFRTDTKWANLYHNEKLFGKPMIESCPLDIISRNKKNLFIVWDLYNHPSQPKEYREIMGIREDIGLMHGLTLSTYFNKHHDAIAIATDDKKNDLAASVLIKDNGEFIKQQLLKCRKNILTSFVKQHRQF